MPRGPQGRLASERAGHVVADEAIAWLNDHRAGPFFLWVHLFEPHAPYGDPSDHRPVGERYDDEVAEADRQVARLVEALGKESASTLIAVASDHGEAFGEHGEISHSVFVYDTTLRVPLVIVGPGIAPSVVHGAVGLVDLAPTLLGQLGRDQVRLGRNRLEGRACRRRTCGARALCRILCAAPRLRLEPSARDPRGRSEVHRGADAGALSGRPLTPASGRTSQRKKRRRRHRSTIACSGSRRRRSRPPVLQDPEAAARLQALGYTSGGPAPTAGARPDPKDRRELAAQIAQVDLRGARRARHCGRARTHPGEGPRESASSRASRICADRRGPMPCRGASLQTGDCRPSPGRGRVPGSGRMPIDVTTIRCGSRHASTSRSCRARESRCRGESRRRPLRRRSSARIDPAVPSCVDARPRLQRGALQSRVGAPPGGSETGRGAARRTSCCGGCRRTRRSVARSNGCVKLPAEVANDIGPTQPMLYNAFRHSIRHNPKADWTASKALDLALTSPFVPPARPSLNRYVLLTCNGCFVPAQLVRLLLFCGRRGSANPSFEIRRPEERCEESSSR